MPIKARDPIALLRQIDARLEHGGVLHAGDDLAAEIRGVIVAAGYCVAFDTRVSFVEWLAERGAGKWCVSRALTPELARKGYDKAISQTRFDELKREFEMWVCRRPAAALPEILAAWRNEFTGKGI